MRIRKRKGMNVTAPGMLLILLAVMLCPGLSGSTLTLAGETFVVEPAAADAPAQETDGTAHEEVRVGGGYAVTGQYPGVAYTSMLYDASNGLPTSDANYVLGASDGYIWIAGYSGIIRYDGSSFTRLDTSQGLANGRGLLEDSKGRIWVGTNDAGVVVMDGSVRTQITYKDGLPSSSIRVFAEDAEGNVLIGTTSGVCYADPDMRIHVPDEERLSGERVVRLDTGPDGTVYGQTKNGLVFAVTDQEVTALYSSEELGTEKITCILADPQEAGKVYLCTESDTVYHGTFGNRAADMERISVAPLSGIHWISWDCGRVWIASTRGVGFLDESGAFRLVEGLPMDTGIEMMTSDFQGNMWFASSTQGVMKVITNQFVNVTKEAGLPENVANVTCLHGDELYIGTDGGLQILDADGNALWNELTDYIANARVRCVTEGREGDIWIGTYTEDRGLVHYAQDGSISAYTLDNGMPDNEIRCICVMEDGRVLAGTNQGMAVIQDGRVTQTIGSGDGILDTVFLTIEEGEDGNAYIGTDGGGIYETDGTSVRRIGREEGLTSDVIIQITKDPGRGVYWVVTSNSIEYMKDGRVTPVTTFPYSNNFDLYFDSEGYAWVIASCGIFAVEAAAMLEDRVTEYRVYTLGNGLSTTPTALCRSALAENGDLYIPGRDGVCRMNIERSSADFPPLKISVNSVLFDEEEILPDSEGVYTLPAADRRISITASVLDYTLLNPRVQVFLEGHEEDGIEAEKNSLLPLEYTHLSYGSYTLHIRALDSSGKTELLDHTVRIVKMPRLTELPFIRFLMILMVAAAAGVIVWRVMKSTIISRQYKELSLAKEEAERANAVKSTFLANMSSEIRTPINAIVGVNEMAIREDAAGVPEPYYTAMMNHAWHIRNASEELLLLINDLLDLSRLETGKMHLTEKEYDTMEMLRSLARTLRLRSAEKNLKAKVLIDEILPSRLYGDERKIRQILLCLISNAVKFTDDGSVAFRVSMEEREDDVCLLTFAVRDTGIGIKKEEMDKLFNVYERLGEEKSNEMQGAGLGLEIAGRLAELMGGRLSCESEYGKGSEFIFTLHQGIRDTTPVGEFPDQEDSRGLERFVPAFIAPDADILVVDDKAENLSVLKGLLQPNRVLVSTASSGEECLERIKDTAFDVVFLSLSLPGIGGVETIERIRENKADLPVYALTDDPIVDEAFYRQKGFYGCLQMPVDSTVLEKIIMQHLPEERMENVILKYTGIRR